jgi:hypothetical protein
MEDLNNLFNHLPNVPAVNDYVHEFNNETQKNEEYETTGWDETQDWDIPNEESLKKRTNIMTLEKSKLEIKEFDIQEFKRKLRQTSKAKPEEIEKLFDIFDNKKDFECVALLMLLNKSEYFYKIENSMVEYIPRIESDIKKTSTVQEFENCDLKYRANILLQTFEWKLTTTLELYWILFYQFSDNPTVLFSISPKILASSLNYFKRLEVERKLLLYLNSDNRDYRLNAADILDRYAVTEETKLRANQTIFVDRHGPIHQNMPNDNNIVNIPLAVHNDKQNVHNSDINKAAMQTIERLQKEVVVPESYGDSLQEIEKDLKSRNLYTEKLDRALQRISIDTSTFSSYMLRLREIIVMIYYRIKTYNQELKNEAIKRLVEELNESEKMCATGYACRLVNTLCGLDNIARVNVTWKKEIEGNIMHKIEQNISKETEELKGDLTIAMMYNAEKEDKVIFIGYINKIWSKLIQDMTEDYQSCFISCKSRINGVQCSDKYCNICTKYNEDYPGQEYLTEMIFMNICTDIKEDIVKKYI